MLSGEWLGPCQASSALIRDLQGVAVGERSPPAPRGPGRRRAAAAAGSPRARLGALALGTLQHFRGNLDDSVQAAGGARQRAVALRTAHRSLRARPPIADEPVRLPRRSTPSS